jgi:hypothetical protein
MLGMVPRRVSSAFSQRFGTKTLLRRSEKSSGGCLAGVQSSHAIAAKNCVQTSGEQLLQYPKIGIYTALHTIEQPHQFQLLRSLAH